MKPFMDKDFLLRSETACALYHGYAKDMPIVDYHCHIDAAEIANDKRYETITELWLGGRKNGGYFGDHYKWRLMRASGVPERLVSGDADPEERFVAWAGALRGAVGNPLYHWTHLELQRYFDIYEPLTENNARAVYRACNAALARPDMSVRGIIQKSNVRLICTTDDPIDSLDAHERIAADPACGVKVLPAFRPDKAMRVDKPAFAAYIRKLECVTDRRINRMDDLRAALLDRIAYFDAHGCRVSDHALDSAICERATEDELNETLRRGLAGEPVSRRAYEAFHTALLLCCAHAYAEKKWVMQLHFGCLRDVSSRCYAAMGADTGYDAMNDGGNAAKLARLLDLLESASALPRTILYSLNPADHDVVASVMGAFQTDSDIPGRMQLGSAWWFNDHKPGMERQLTSLMSLGSVGTFVGMLTDSRSFLSYTRHEYFRRILCDKLGELAENGEYPADVPTLGALVQDVSYRNAVRYFRLGDLIGEEA